MDTLRHVGYKVNWDATFWWPYIMQIAPTIASNNSSSSSSGGSSSSNFTELWGSALDAQPGYNNRLSTVHVQASYAIRDAYYEAWQAANLTVGMTWERRRALRAWLCVRACVRA